MRLAHVTYDQAKKLKEKGFDKYVGQCYIGKEYCNYIGWKNGWKINEEHGFKPDSGHKYQPMIPAPLYVEVMEWLRTGKNLQVWISPQPFSSSGGWSFNLVYRENGRLINEVRHQASSVHLSYDDAQSECLDYILKNIL